MTWSFLHRFFAWQGAAVLLACSLASGAAPATSAGEHVAQGGPCDLWLITTRPAGIACDPTGRVDRLQFYRYQQGAGWQRASLDAFLADGDFQVPTAFFVHGNSTSAEDANRTGWRIYRLLTNQAPDASLRFVIWSWPSDRQRIGLAKDARINTFRSDDQGYYLAWLVDQIGPDVHVSLFGYSAGARLVASALHLLGGGTISGQHLPSRVHPRREPLRALFIAAVVDANGLAPGHRHGRALSQVDHMLVTVNSCDPVLHFYPLLYHLHGPESLGYSGVGNRRLLADQQGKVELLKLSGSIGRHHALDSYLSSARLVRAMRRYAHFEDPSSVREPAGALDEPLPVPPGDVPAPEPPLPPEPAAPSGAPQTMAELGATSPS